MYRYFKRVVNSDYILEWKSKVLPDESIKSPSAPPNFLNHGKIVNIYIVYEINKSDKTNSDLTLENCLFGAVSLTKNADIDRYKYSGYGIGLTDIDFLLILVVELVEM